MKREKSIELLNLAVNQELSAVHQYIYFHFRCDDQSYELLSHIFKHIAIHEMIHVEKLVERILFLKGDIDMFPSGKVEKLVDPKDMLEKTYRLETDSINKYNAWAGECGEESDAALKTMFVELGKEEEIHQKQVEMTLAHLKQFGDRYLALQLFEYSKIVARPSGYGS